MVGSMVVDDSAERTARSSALSLGYILATFPVLPDPVGLFAHIFVVPGLVLIPNQKALSPESLHLADKSQA